MKGLIFCLTRALAGSSKTTSVYFGLTGALKSCRVFLDSPRTDGAYWGQDYYNMVTDLHSPSGLTSLFQWKVAVLKNFPVY